MAEHGASAPLDPATSACVLYDPKNGNITHIHRCFVFPGGRNRSEEELASKTKELATMFGRDTSYLKILHLPDNVLHPEKAYRIDLDKLTPLEIPMKIRS